MLTVRNLMNGMALFE